METESTNPYIETAISRVFPSVVRLVLREADTAWRFSRTTNGTIFSCIPDDDSSQFLCYILTSADLFKISKPLRHGQKGVSQKKDLFKLYVFLPTKTYKGEVMACDKEINMAVVKIKSVAPLPIASLTPFTDWISVSPFGVPEHHAPSCQSPYPTNVIPGDEVTVVCCPFETLKHPRPRACSGIYSADYIGFQLDRKPFLRISCEKIISGAPVINCEGDVIGVAFKARDRAVFLPVNVFFKWWKQVVTYGEIRRPWMGIQIANLYTAGLGYLEAIVHDCDVSDGVIVEEVISKSPADSANMRPKDVICQCDGRPVRSFLEFTELLWDKCGEVIEAKGVRGGCHFVWKIKIEAIKSGILPKSVVTLKKLTTKERKAKDKKNSKKGKKGVTDVKAKKRKIEGESGTGADVAVEKRKIEGESGTGADVAVEKRKIEGESGTGADVAVEKRKIEERKETLAFVQLFQDLTFNY